MANGAWELYRDMWHDKLHLLFNLEVFGHVSSSEPKTKPVNSDSHCVYGTHAYCAVLSSFVSYKSIHNRFTIGMPSFIGKQNLV